MIDINSLKDKKSNVEQQAYIEENGIPANETLTAGEFVEKIVKPIIELQGKTQEIEESMVKGIKMGVTSYYPEEGIVTLPGADSQVGVYINLEGNTIVSVTGKLVLGIRATSTVGGANTGEVVEISVMTSTQGSTDWSLGGKFKLNTKGFASNDWDEVDITEYVGTGNHNVQLVATGQRTGVTGYSETFSAVLTSMRLVCQQNYQTPIDTITYSTFPIAYTVYGTVAKDLHVKIQGSVATEELVYSLGVQDDSVTFRRSIAEDAAYGLLTHGVHKVEAWLTADDGQGNILESDHLVNRFMVVNRNTEGVDLSKPYLLIQNELSVATNFVQTTICDYAVYSPNIDDDGHLVNSDGRDLNMVFLVTAYALDYISEQPEEYFRMEQKVSPNTQNSLNITVEIEPKEGEEEQTQFNSYLRAYRMEGNSLVEMLSDSIGSNNMFVAIDNTDSFAPMSGADFVLNPKVRNNTESNPMRILNARKNNAEIVSYWENFGFVNDGWVVNKDDNQKVLRVPAGAKLKLAYNPFSQFLTTPDSSMTLEFDMAIRNMTDEDEQIIGINQLIDGQIIGLVIRPITGVLFTSSNVVEDESDFRWQEDKRVHISININNSINPDMGDAYKPTADTGIDTNNTSIALIRIFINGMIEREMKYSLTNRNEFLTSDVSVNASEINNGIEIGSSSADIDIYSIRCYKSVSLEADDVQNNWIASLPTSEEKLEARRQNAIKSAGKVDVEKVKSLGKRVLIWHGKEPYYYAADAQRGWWEIFQYNDDGTLNRELSGTIAKETGKKEGDSKGGLKATRQGSTANTYYYSNIQTKIKDLEEGEFIKVNIADLHSSIILGEPYEELDEETKEPTGKMLVDITGGNLGKNYPIEAKTAPYEYITEGVNRFVMVPDGWVDGNGKYRGLGIIITEGTPMAQKVVNKINYASPMQSHLCGCTRAYSDLHTAVVGKNSIQEACKEARVTKYTEPFFYFVQEEGSSSPVYRGLGTFGGGKADKPTWGYVKSKHPMMMMVEGSDNNYTMTDFRCPWDSKVSYNAEDEGWMRAGLQHWDFDMGATDVHEKGTPDEYETPKEALTNLWKEAYNFIYMHAPMLQYYVGTFAAFKDSIEAQNTTKKYWCTEGADAFKLKRYDDVLSQWVDAGLETETEGVYEVIDLTTHKYTAAAYESSANKTDFNKLNQEFIAAIVADYKKYLGWYFKPGSVRFHYCFINHLMAGTDNCSKNIYFVSDPKAVDVTIDGVTKSCYLFEMHQDDVDTIGPTDNNGRSTKPYYIDRMHPFSDKDSKTSCYEGNNSAFFNLCELAFEGTLELQSTMKRIFDAMSDIMSSNTDRLIEFDGSATNTVWGFFHRYFFNIQRYFCNTAFNENARIRYEYPAMINYTSRGPGARGIAPITQSVGAQMQSEIQYYRRRLVLMASYAAWGDFYDGGKTHKIGISEAADSFPLQAFHLPDSATSNTEYKFTVIPHQYIYPTGVMGQTAVDPHKRLKPGESYIMSLGTTTSNDTGMSLLGINYYKSIGNIGDLSVSPNITVTINGKRLVEFIAEPTKLYVDMETGESVPAFRPGSINITSNRLVKLSLNGCKQIGGTLDTSALTRIEEIDVRNTNINNVKFPQSTSIQRIYLGKTRSIELSDMPRLSVFSLSDYSVLTSFTIGHGVPLLNSYSVVAAAYNANAPLSHMSLGNIDWKSCDVNVLDWLCGIQSVAITGDISVKEESEVRPSVTFVRKALYITKWGNVDDAASPEHKGLLLHYTIRDIANITIKGEAYTHDKDKTYQYTAVPQNQYMNNFVKIVWGWQWQPDAVESAKFTLNEKTGELYVEELSRFIDGIILNVRVYKPNGEYINSTKNIGLYDRQPKLGDYVFADGTYSDSQDENKTVVAVCCYVAPEADERELLFLKEDKQKRLCVATQNAACTASGGTVYSSFSFGPYRSNTDAVNGLYKADGTYITFDSDGSEIYDVSNVVNLTSSGLSAVSDPNEANYGSASYIRTSNIRDNDSSEGILNDGFKVFNEYTSMGDGFAYNDGSNTSNNPNATRQARILNQELALLTDGQYKEGDIVNSGYVKTLKYIAWRNRIIEQSEVTPLMIEAGCAIPASGSAFTEMQSLANNMELMDNYQKSIGETNFAKWRQLFMPAASIAYAFEPTQRLLDGETLSSKLKAHQWFLPPLGLLARLYWYYYIGAANKGNIFSKAISEGKFTNFSASYHWSATEFNATYTWLVNFSNGYISNYNKSYSFVVRPVCAF